MSSAHRSSRGFRSLPERRALRPAGCRTLLVSLRRPEVRPQRRDEPILPFGRHSDAHLVVCACASRPEIIERPYGSQMDEDSPAPFAALLRRYSYAYTARPDLDVCPQIMTDDYVLRMGEHVLRGRDEAYIPATQRQFRQYPSLGF